MSKRHPNPVSKHFIYSEQTRKSTCKECRFDMAGRHSENLMRHLKRKHEDVYETVVAEKRAIRKLLCQQQANKQSPTMELSDFFPSELKKIRLSKDASHLPTNSTIENTDLMDDEEAGDGDNEDNVSGSQFDGIFKSELPDDEDDQSVDSRDIELETVEVSMAKPSISLKPATTHPAPNVASSSTSVVPARAPTASPAASASTPLVRAPSSADCPLAGEDAFYLQYLGNKLSKYSARTKNTVQFQINRILYRADMGRFEDADPKEADSDLYF
ncbi:uncharacterized protein LOC108137199 isoform X2 [Drosophila elegans]|uniref:uncharacterized protein LOC108137199 isoform X2 n=1 Tax=Drosophila elegans TaxID=30023 RepID=UPI0007E75B76|nr:uncharacterized protein LOC108137199 isoform X2 [Drosophila elegans]